MSRLEEALKKAEDLRSKFDDSYRKEQHDERRPVPDGKPLADIKAAFPEKISHLIVSLLDPCSPAAEEYKKLRTAVLRAMTGRTGKTVLVTSPEKGNGKSCTAANLAVSIAAIGQPVLLVDTDLRKPSIHNYFGIELNNGLSECLMGKADAEDIIKWSGIGALSVITAGIPAANSPDVLSSDRMGLFMAGLKTGHKGSLIIFDSPPLLSHSDSVSLGQHVDGILLVIEAAKTRPDAVKRSLDLLKDLPLMGTVLNNVPEYLTKILNPYYY